jgi:translation initiation factor IF-1
VALNRGGIVNVRLDHGHEINATNCGKMNKAHVRCYAGDRVKCLISPYGLDKGIIQYRWIG